MVPTDVQIDSIEKLYLGYFGRVADPSGLVFWSSKLSSGGMTLQDIADAFASHPEAAGLFGTLDIADASAAREAFINRLYENLFHRQAEAAGLAGWSQQLSSGVTSEGVIKSVIGGAQGSDAATLSRSASLATGALSNGQTIGLENLYFGFFGRTIDPSGLATWSAALASGQMTLLDLANNFATQVEAKLEYAYLNAPNLSAGIPAFIDAVYHNLFHRGVDASGLTTYSAELAAGRPAGSVIFDIFQSAQGSDSVALLTNAALTNVAIGDVQKASVAGLYVGLFGRAADPQGLNVWVGKLASGELTLGDVAANLASQAEAQAVHPYLSAPNLEVGIPDFIDLLYHNLFHRSADQSGLTTWSNELLNGVPAGQLVLDIINAARAGDAATLANKQAVSLAYMSAVLQGGVKWTLTDFRGDAVQVLAGVTSDPASVTAASASLPQLIAAESAPFKLVANAPSVDEGSTALFTLSARGAAAGTLLSYQISGVQTGDILGALSGITYVDALGTALIAVNIAADNLTEGSETLTVTVAGLSASTTINDTSQSPTTFTLTQGVDILVGSDHEDTFNSYVSGGLSSLDSIDGGAGTDTLNVLDTSAINVGSLETIRNVEIANLTSAAGITANVTSWTGLVQLNATGNGTGNTLTAAAATAVNSTSTATGSGQTSVQGGQNVTVVATGSTTGGIVVGATLAPTGAIAVSNAAIGAVALGAIYVTGGTTVTTTQTVTNAVHTTATMGTVAVLGGAATTAVTVTNAAAATASSTVAGVTANTVNVTDVNSESTTATGTINSVTISNYTTVAIGDNALTTLNLAGGSGNVIIANGGLTAPTNRTLNLGVNHLTGGTLDDEDIYTTLNVTTSGAASTLANITDAALTSLNVGGTKALTLTSTAGMSALTTVTVTGTAGLTADFSNTVTAVDTSATSGASRITIDASRATFIGGAGADTVITTAATVTKAISLGDGDDMVILGGANAPTANISGGAGVDSLTMNATLAATASGSSSFAGKVTGFEQLVLTGSTNQTVDLAVLGITGQVTTSGGNGLSLSNLSNGGTLALTGAGTAYTIANSAFVAGSNDTINLKLTDGSSAGVSYASTGITSAGVEHIAIAVMDTQATPTGSFNDSVTLLGNSAKTITVAGNAGLTLTATDTALTSVDASTIALGGFTFTSGALSGASIIKGSAAGTNIVDVSSATGGAVSYTGGSGNDSVTATNGKSNVVALGDGTNSYVASGGAQFVTGGSGNDAVIVGSGNNTVSLGNGTNSFTATSGNNTYTGGTGIDTVTIGAGSNSITLGTGANTLTQTAVNTNLNTYSTLLDPLSGDTLGFVDKGTETFNATKVVLANTAVFQDFADAVIQQGGDAAANGAFGWFQFSGDTYLVESRHDGSGGSASFSNGNDAVLKLAGLVDLSTAIFTGTQNFVLA